MAYRVHRDGYIQAREVQFELPYGFIHCAQQVGATRIEGIVRELADCIGVEVEGIENVRVDGRRVILTSSWVRPSRR